MHYFVGKLLPEERGSIPYLPTTAELLKFLKEKYPEQTALSDENRTVTYRELVHHAACRRSLLMKQGVQPGNGRVAPLVERLWAADVTVAVPYWHAEAQTYRLAIYTNATTLIEGAHGIMEPAEVYEIATEDIGAWIVPGLAFTLDGRRLGYGGGWYDRYLAAAAPGALALAVAYPFQMLDDLPADAHDRRVSTVVLAERA